MSSICFKPIHGLIQRSMTTLLVRIYPSEKITTATAKTNRKCRNNVMRVAVRNLLLLCAQTKCMELVSKNSKRPLNGREEALRLAPRGREWKKWMKQKAVCCSLCVINAAGWGSFHAHWSRSLCRNCCLLGPDRPCIGFQRFMQLMVVLC